jgi:hypothetical protein
VSEGLDRLLAATTVADLIADASPASTARARTWLDTTNR